MSKYSQGIQWTDKDGNQKKVEVSGQTGSDACEKAVIEAFVQGWRPCIPQINETVMDALREIREFAHKGLVLRISPVYKDYQIIMEIADKAIKDVVLGDHTMMGIRSKISPTGHHVLVLPDVVKEKTDGGIFLAPQSREQEQRAATKGLLVGIGPSAWKEFADGEPWAVVGDYVSFAKFAGIEMDGADGKKYMLLNDQDVLAVLKQ